MRRALLGQVAVGLLSAAVLAGCVGDNGGVSMASLGTEATPVETPAVAPAPVSMGPLLEGPMGSRLAQADRQSAFVAETQALSNGDRRTWKGSRGVYGFVVPGGTTSSSAGGECRTFTHTIYFAGRPQTGTGTGCKSPDGSWQIVS